MKKFKRRSPLFSPFKITVIILCVIIINMLMQWLVEIENEYFIVLYGITLALIFPLLFSVLAVCHEYAYCNIAINLYFLGFKYREIKYTDFSFVYISNASYNNGYGYGIYGNIPMQRKIAEATGERKQTYPFLSLHRLDYPFQKIKTDMNSRDLFMLDSENIVCLGICWFDSLIELIKNTTVDICILEDVYLRFRGEFDDIFLQYGFDTDRFFIISEHKVPYITYRNMTQERHKGTVLPSPFQKR